MHDLVGGRGSVGHEERVLGAVGAGRKFLGLLQRVHRGQERIQATGGRRGLGQQQVQPVEVQEVLDPLGAHHRTTAGNRQGVEHTHRAAGMLLDRGEERGVVQVGHPAQQREVQLQLVLAPEHTAEAMGQGTGEALDVRARHEVQVHLGAQRGEGVGQAEHSLNGCERGAGGGRFRAHQVARHLNGALEIAAQRLPGALAESWADNARENIGVGQDRGHGIIRGGHDHVLVNEVIGGGAQPQALGAQAVTVRGGALVHDQNFEPGTRVGVDQQVRVLRIVCEVIAGRVRHGVTAEPVDDLADPFEGHVVIALFQHLPDGGDVALTESGPVHLHGFKGAQRAPEFAVRGEGFLVLVAECNPFHGEPQVLPGVAAQPPGAGGHSGVRFKDSRGAPPTIVLTLVVRGRCIHGMPPLAPSPALNS